MVGGNGHRSKNGEEHVTETPDVSYIRNLDVAYERSDVNTKAILKFIGWLAALTALCFLIVVGMFKYFEASAERSEAETMPTIRREGEQRLPPEPRLQLAPGHAIHPLDDLKRLRAEEDAVLKNYGWVNREAGIVQIPVERAKELLVERGVPVRPSANGQTESQGVYIPSQQSSGRMVEKRVRETSLR
ncbi:MAG: hypothetical protein C4334_07030 [Pyrinomonas sp.]|uniref:hypothetical protein n=1 Tax=Pyrinomonas sp. TaxID=2080306 RepID=UPI00331C0214